MQRPPENRRWLAGAGVRAALVACSAFAAQACGEGSDTPTWIELARGFEPQPLLEVAAGWEEGNDGSTTRVHPHEERGEVWIEAKLPAQAWERDGPAWSTARPQHGRFAYLSGGPTRLTATAGSERVLTRAQPTDDPQVDHYVITAERILFVSEDLETPPVGLLFGVRTTSGQSTEGVWRVLLGNRVAAGLPVWSGSKETIACDVRHPARLRFAAQFRPGSSSGDAPATFRVRSQDELLWEREVGEQAAFFEVRVPEGERQLSFEVDGAPGLGAFLGPTIGPEAIGGYGERPYDRRPDLVLFLADTFRADNLAFYGGPQELTPALNAFAKESMRFANVRAPAAWTLPSISSLLTGLFPGQHGATDEGLRLSGELETITETLRAAGYRTGAITDSGFFNFSFGLDQGFEWFEQRLLEEWDLDRTLAEARAFLERDDGRPVFLVVHTYRAHGPYRQGSEEDQSAWDELIADCYERLEGEALQNQETKRRILLSIAPQTRELYLDGVRDLDRGFGEFLTDLEQRGLLERGYLVFTSDHGEAFGENQDYWHGGKLWDVKLRVPLLVHGFDLEAREVPFAASLVDLAPTLGQLARLTPRAQWTGTSLLSLDRERPQFAFRIEAEHRELAVHDGQHKLLAEPDAAALGRSEFNQAFDLGRDPGEEHDLTNEADWPAELAQRVSKAVELFLTPSADSDAVAIDPETQQELRDLGYGGGH